MYDDLVTPSFADLLNNVGNDIKSIKYPPIFLCLLKFISDNGSQRKNTILFIYPYSPFFPLFLFLFLLDHEKS